MDELLKRAKLRCADCVALREGRNGEWECDESSTPITQVAQCNEWDNKEDGRI